MSFWSPGASVPVTADFVPVTTGTYSIGSTTFRWLDGWFSRNLFIGGRILVGDAISDPTTIPNGALTTSNKAAIYGDVDQVYFGAGLPARGQRFARGAIGAPTSVQDGDRLSTDFSGGYHSALSGTGNWANPVAVQVFVDGSTAGVTTAIPGRWEIHTTPLNGARTLRMRVNSIGTVTILSHFSRGVPITKTADWTQGDTENWIISDRGATNTVTLPSAATYPGREIMVKTIQAFTVVSASANVVPRIGGAAGTAILPATDGAWATLVSDGANWVIMQSGI